MSVVHHDQSGSIRLARPHYRVGGTVVGTVAILKPSQAVLLTALGGCKLDPRWHPTTVQFHPLSSVPPLDNHTLPFWIAGALELSDYQERSMNHSWESTKPKPILGRKPIPGDDLGVWEDNTRYYTFRFQLPNDGPPSLIATSCRYYYLVAVKLQHSDGTMEWIKLPFNVLTASAVPPHPAVTDEFQAMAHSNGLPIPLTAMELHQPEGTYSVQHCSYSSTIRGTAPTLTIVDPTSHCVAASLSLIGATKLHPGSRMILQLDFAHSTIPVHQVSACLRGEELALSGNKATRARKYIFDTAHELVDPDCIEQLSLDLFLPANAPVTLKTEQIEITVRVILDIAVERGEDTFGNIHLEIPCQVTHAEYDWETEEPDEVPGLKTYQELNESVARQTRSDDPRDPSSFRSTDIIEELKLLSLSIADDLGLRP